MGEKKVQKVFAISNMDLALLTRLRMYAAGYNMPLYKAIDKLLWRGLEAEANHPSPEDSHVDILVVTRPR